MWYSCSYGSATRLVVDCGERQRPEANSDHLQSLERSASVGRACSRSQSESAMYRCASANASRIVSILARKTDRHHHDCKLKQTAGRISVCCAGGGAYMVCSSCGELCPIPATSYLPAARSLKSPNRQCSPDSIMESATASRSSCGLPLKDVQPDERRQALAVGRDLPHLNLSARFFLRCNTGNAARIPPHSMREFMYICTRLMFKHNSF